MTAEFTKEMKKTHTILAPDIFPVHMRLLTKVFALYGYNVEVLHYEGKDVIDTGLSYLHNDICYPAICSIGQQLYALKSGKYDTQKVALIQFQTGGGCRASNYICLLRKALENMGYDYIPVISVSTSNIEKCSGFKLTPMMMYMSLKAIIYGDFLMLLKNQVKPYEKKKGETDKLVDYWINKLTTDFASKKSLNNRSMKKNLKSIAKSFHEIERVDRKLKKVGIVGEIYVKYSPFANNNLEEFLLKEGCEYMVPGVLAFFEFCFSDAETNHKYYGKNRVSMYASKTVESIASSWEKDMEDALKPYPEFVCPAPFKRIKKLAENIIDRGVNMGEGWLLPGEVAELIENGYNNIICAQPFGCLPNHIVGKGTIRTLRMLYPNANIFPIDYDAGASKVNQENRIKLMLAIAEEGEK